MNKWAICVLVWIKVCNREDKYVSQEKKTQLKTDKNTDILQLSVDTEDTMIKYILVCMRGKMHLLVTLFFPPHF